MEPIVIQLTVAELAEHLAHRAHEPLPSPVAIVEGGRTVVDLGLGLSAHPLRLGLRGPSTPIREKLLESIDRGRASQGAFRRHQDETIVVTNGHFGDFVIERNPCVRFAPLGIVHDLPPARKLTEGCKLHRGGIVGRADDAVAESAAPQSIDRALQAAAHYPEYGRNQGRLAGRPTCASRRTAAPDATRRPVASAADPAPAAVAACSTRSIG